MPSAGGFRSMARQPSPWNKSGTLRSWRPEIALFIFLIALTAAACGGGGDNTSAASPAIKTSAATKTVSPTGDQSAAAEIDQVNLTFTPNKVTVKVGERVRFKSSDDAIHTVNINGKNISGNMKKGDVIYWTAPKAGTYKVTCDYHPQMLATITVQ